MKILLLGANGQVGWQLRRSLAVLGEVVALDRMSVVAGAQDSVAAGEKAGVAGEKARVAGEKAGVAGEKAGVAGEKAVIAGSTRNPSPDRGSSQAGRWMPGQARHDKVGGQAPHDEAGRHDVVASGDLSHPEAVAEAVRAVRPDLVVNAAAYTAVDRAEDDRDAAFKVNAKAPEALARATSELGIWLVHYSTDYVYDGTGEQPWREGDPTGPLGVYGQTKLAGDQAIAAHNPRHLILRTSWVYDSWGQNFAKSILKAAATRDALTVVADQWGAPTRAALIADVTAHALRTLTTGRAGDALAGTYHLAASGCTTWHAYAQLLVQEAQARGLPLRVTPDRVKAIPASAYPVKAPRPANSRLDTTRLRQTFGLALPDWQDGVRAVVAELASETIRHRPASTA